MSGTYFFLQPVLAHDRSWVALNWQPASLHSIDSTEFTQCFNQSAIAPLAKILPLVMPVNPEYLHNPEFVDTFEKEPVLLVLPPGCLDNESILQQCRDLQSRGVQLALQIDSPETLHRVPFPLFGSIRLDALMARQDFSVLDMIYASDTGFRKIATSVDSYSIFDWLKSKGAEWSDGFFLTTPNPELRRDPQLVLAKLLKLLNLIKHDGETRDIEAVFREEAKLSYNLLRLVNSVAVGARTKISSFSQAIAILGRRQLQRWLQLLVYSNNMPGNAPNPLMQLAAARGRQMELLSAAIDPVPDIPDLSDNAFLTGLFSLLDVLINLPMDEILKEIALQDEVVDALVNRNGKGVLGQLLSAIVAGEASDFSRAADIFSELGINPATHAKSQVTAYYWASRINIENNS